MMLSGVALFLWVLFLNTSIATLSVDDIEVEPYYRDIPEPTLIVPLKFTPNGRRYTIDVHLDDPHKITPLVVDTGSYDVVTFFCHDAVSSQVECWSRDTNEISSLQLSYAVDGRKPTIRQVRTEDTLIGVIISEIDEHDNAAETEGSILVGVVYDGSDDAITYWRETGGQFGVLPQTNSIFWSMFNTTMFSLSVNATSGNTWLEIGGATVGRNENVVWSERSVSHVFDYFHMPLFEVSLCGVNILGNYSSTVWALADTGSECLGLPPYLFHMVQSWLPALSCEAKQDPRRHACSISTEDVSKLPPIVFRMSSTSEPVYLYLQDLVSDEANQNGFHAICLHDLPLEASNVEMVVFGSMVFRSFRAVFDLDTHRVALIQDPMSRPFVSGNDSLCGEMPVCLGDQKYYEPSNSCFDPPCSSLLFKTVDDSSKTCKFDDAFSILAVLTLIVFAASEFVLLQIYHRTVQACLDYDSSLQH